MSGAIRIVVVEDATFQRHVIAKCLAERGLRSTTLGSGVNLKRFTERTMPDLALLNMRLGRTEDSFVLARWLRAARRGSGPSC